MKLHNHEPHDHSEQENSKHLPIKIKQYLQNFYNSKKCKNMSHGSYYITRCMSWAHGENWRRNHSKSK
ncbi:MAG TPA: hypothetical protein VLB80_04075 [Candidatus Babeliales bacterium]|nr:hypothetical protein [Candidatus Babeliales bacterium]